MAKSDINNGMMFSTWKTRAIFSDLEVSFLQWIIVGKNRSQRGKIGKGRSSVCNGLDRN